jgi:hypothetical protein
MVDVGKREDALLDRLGEYRDAIGLARFQIDFYRGKGLTEREIEMLLAVEKCLEIEKKAD